MNSSAFCQSCTMPLDPDMRGTEKDGSPSQEYCKYCYQDGVFTKPDMTIDEMSTIVKTEMAKMNLDPGLIAMSLNMLPTLGRWKAQK